MKQRYRFKSNASQFKTNLAAGAGTIVAISANSTNSKPFAPGARHTALEGTIDSVQVKWHTASAHSFMIGFFSGSTNATLAGSNQLIDYITMSTFSTFIHGTVVHYVKNGLSIPYRDASQGAEFHVGVYAHTAALTLTTGATDSNFQVEFTWRPENVKV